MHSTVTAFLGDERIARGTRDEVTRLIEDRYAPADQSMVRVFDDESGRTTDLDYWDAGSAAGSQPARGRGRPRLGVTSREVTLLPRHWEWLSKQPGGASATIRRLIEDARKSGANDLRRRQDAAFHFMQAMCGDRPGYEESLRALYRGEFPRLQEIAAAWPPDVADHIEKLLTADR
jgi:hypothetical protein